MSSVMFLGAQQQWRRVTLPAYLLCCDVVYAGVFLSPIPRGGGLVAFLISRVVADEFPSRCCNPLRLIVRCFFRPTAGVASMASSLAPLAPLFAPHVLKGEMDIPLLKHQGMAIAAGLAVSTAPPGPRRCRLK